MGMCVRISCCIQINAYNLICQLKSNKQQWKEVGRATAALGTWHCGGHLWGREGQLQPLPCWPLAGAQFLHLCMDITSTFPGETGGRSLALRGGSASPKSTWRRVYGSGEADSLLHGHSGRLSACVAEVIGPLPWVSMERELRSTLWLNTFVPPFFSPCLYQCVYIYTHVVCTSHALLPVAYMTSEVLITVLSGVSSSREALIEQPVATSETRQNAKAIPDGRNGLMVWCEMPDLRLFRFLLLFGSHIPLSWNFNLVHFFMSSKNKSCWTLLCLWDVFTLDKSSFSTHSNIRVVGRPLGNSIFTYDIGRKILDDDSGSSGNPRRR